MGGLGTFAGTPKIVAGFGAAEGLFGAIVGFTGFGGGEEIGDGFAGFGTGVDAGFGVAAGFDVAGFVVAAGVEFTGDGCGVTAIVCPPNVTVGATTGRVGVVGAAALIAAKGVLGNTVSVADTDPLIGGSPGTSTSTRAGIEPAFSNFKS